MWASYRQWSGLEVFDPLKEVADKLLRAGGIEIENHASGDPYCKPRTGIGFGVGALSRRGCNGTTSVICVSICQSSSVRLPLLSFDRVSGEVNAPRPLHSTGQEHQVDVVEVYAKEQAKR